MGETVAPSEPSLEFVFAIRARIGEARSGGQSPRGERLHIPITGGSVEGPMLTGTVQPGGSDWPLIRRDGISEISAKYTIMSADGTLILVENNGLRVSPAKVLTRLRAGAPVHPSEFYFRAAPVFEAPDGPHAWLNESLFVSSIARDGDVIRVDVYRVR